MKSLSTLLLVSLLCFGCKKTISIDIQSVNAKQLSDKKFSGSLDTLTIHKNFSANSTAGISWSSSVNYAGNGKYTFTITTNPTGLRLSCQLYRNGQVYETEQTTNSPFSATYTLPPGLYNILFSIGEQASTGTDPNATSAVTIIDQPTAPTGMICLYRYFNNSSGQHICTSNWEELGSCSVGYQVEKVLGYMYSSSSDAMNLKPIYRYYKNSDGSHFTTDIQGNYTGFVFEKILGYVGTSQTPTLSRSLTKYYLSSTDDHFVCVPPDVPTYPGFTKDVDFTFGYVQ